MTFPEYCNEDSILWLALDVPNPRTYAEMILMTRRDLARELLAARKVKTGEWKFRYDPDPRLIANLRELGLCCHEHVMTNSYELTHFAQVVRNRLIQILATRELETPLENGDAAE